jgi:DNA-directed RNA polymerase subunit RPC12/RpoP
MALEIPLNQSTRILRFYLCSDCWEPMREIARDRIEQTITIACQTKDCPCRGMVSEQHVLERERQAHEWLRNARLYLADELPWIKSIPKRTQAQIIQALGYF